MPFKVLFIIITNKQSFIYSGCTFKSRRRSVVVIYEDGGIHKAMIVDAGDVHTPLKGVRYVVNKKFLFATLVVRLFATLPFTKIFLFSWIFFHCSNDNEVYGVDKAGLTVVSKTAQNLTVYWRFAICYKVWKTAVMPLVDHSSIALMKNPN